MESDVRKLIDEIKIFKIEPNIEVLKFLLGRTKNYNEVEIIVEELKILGLTLNKEIYEILLVLSESFIDANKILIDMEKNKIKPSSDMFTTFASKVEDYNQLERVRKKFERVFRGQTFNDNMIKVTRYEERIRDDLRQDLYEQSKDKPYTTVIIPPLEPKKRKREYDSYTVDVRDKVVYDYLFNGNTHRWIDENIIETDSSYSRGYQAMGILHYIGLKDKHKGIFKGYNILDAVNILKYVPDDFNIVINSLIRKSKKYIEEGKKVTEFELNFDYDENEYAEGKESFKVHRYRERNPKLIKLAKERFEKANKGKLFCEVCEINFEEVYGERGKGFIEAHHTIPVSEMKEGEKTKLDDIAMLCSNCHRMIHRSPLLTVQQLKELIKK